VAARLRVAIVINPVAGVRGTLERARTRGVWATDLLRARGLDAEVVISERHGHARELAAAAVRSGARIVAAWGGDGTVNEVATALLGSDAALAVIPAGSGNGLARMLRVPANPRAAIDWFLDVPERRIDVGDIDGRVFVNVAGVGFDAHIAAAFAKVGRARRGLLRYGAIVARELWRYDSRQYSLALSLQGSAACAPEGCTAFLLSFANGTQWGNGAIIAPAAALDDGLLDAVRVEVAGPMAAARALPHLFRGTIEGVRGVSIVKVRSATVTADLPLVYHADGESFVGGTTLQVGVRERVLRIRA
jgi:diacylglycerol kinase (ATP)